MGIAFTTKLKKTEHINKLAVIIKHDNKQKNKR